MKVLLANPFAALGGGERSLLDVIAGVRAADGGGEISFQLVVSEPGPLVEAARAMGVEAFVLELPKALTALGDGQRSLFLFAKGLVAAPFYLARLRHLILRLSPDIVHSNGVKMHILLAACALPKRTKLIWHVRDYLSRRRLSRVLLRRLKGKVSLVLANSDSVKQDAEGLFGKIPVSRVYNGIDASVFTPGNGDRELPDRLCGEKNLATPHVKIALIATYARWKGHELFLEAINLFKYLRPEVAAKFYVVGGPIYKTGGSQVSLKQLQDQAVRLGIAEDVRFVAFQSDAAPLFRTFDVIVNASLEPEPFGRTVAEGLACAKPVVVADHGGAAEILTGPLRSLAFKPGDARALADAMHRLAASAALRADLGHAGRKAVEARFSRETLGVEMLRIYLRVNR